MTRTIRQHLEAIRETHERSEYREPGKPRRRCVSCVDHYWPCPSHEHAVAALAILAASEAYQRGALRADACRLVSDPAPPTENT